MAIELLLADAERRIVGKVELSKEALSTQIEQHDTRTEAISADTRVSQQRLEVVLERIADNLSTLVVTATAAQKAIPNGRVAIAERLLGVALRVIFLLVGILALLILGPEAANLLP